MDARLSRFAIVFLAACWSAPAQADPLVMFLFSAAREILTSAVQRSPAQTDPLPEVSQTYPGTAVRPADLQRVVEESFGYLSERQRREVFDSLHGMLLNPKLAGSRAALIEYFMHKALAVRIAQSQLESLSQADKRDLAARFGGEIAGLPDEERQRLLVILQTRLLPVPADLNQMLLAEMRTDR